MINTIYSLEYDALAAQLAPIHETINHLVLDGAHLDPDKREQILDNIERLVTVLSQECSDNAIIEAFNNAQRDLPEAVVESYNYWFRPDGLPHAVPDGFKFRQYVLGELDNQDERYYGSHARIEGYAEELIHIICTSPREHLYTNRGLEQMLENRVHDLANKRVVQFVRTVADTSDKHARRIKLDQINTDYVAALMDHFDFARQIVDIFLTTSPEQYRCFYFRADMPTEFDIPKVKEYLASATRLAITMECQDHPYVTEYLFKEIYQLPPDISHDKGFLDNLNRLISEAQCNNEQELVQLAAMYVPDYNTERKIGDGSTFTAILIRKELPTQGKNICEVMLVPKQEADSPSGRRQMTEIGLAYISEKEFSVMHDLTGVKGVPNFYGDIAIKVMDKKVNCDKYEYVEGISLDKVIADHLESIRSGHPTSIAIATVAEYFIHVLEVLGGIHSRGYVHNDVSPNNIIIGPKGTYLIDFGLTSSDSHEVKGYASRRYSSPELLNQEQALTPASDLYSVGAILYHMLTGHHPISDDSTEIVAIVSDSDKFSQVTVDYSHVHPEVAKVIDKTLQYKPEDRYHSAFEFTEDLKKGFRAFMKDARPSE
ncbi:MAG: serine/threonine protein kinase [Nanoarchaeota archaeon]|nr:serine/threonine protein kinase [Nanoarchaeota archaeon]MBU1704407.1 serine/threonine protein kinase [Nanoarchaeota archaeon]